MQTNLPDISLLKSPVWCFNGHLHTVARSLSFPGKADCKRIEIATPDNDFLELDVIDAQNERPVVVLFHGLEGSSGRYYMVELMQQFSALSYSVVAVNFRSCGDQMNRQKRFYHSGETKDPATVFSWVEKKFPQSAMAAVGFSLGGNVLLKSLGEQGGVHPLRCAVVVSVPYNLKAGSLKINQGFNKIYQHVFLKSLAAKLEEKRRQFSALPAFGGSTLYEFDDQITGPVHGFAGADDYYRQCSSRHFVQDIATPTLLIHSGEDPICAADEIPIKKVKENKCLDYIITERGGHVGFCSRRGGWLNKVVVNYICQKID